MKQMTLISATATETQTANELDFELKMEKLRSIIEKMGLQDKVELTVLTEEKKTEKSEAVREGKVIWTVTLSDNSVVDFESTDEKAAKYRAYRIGRDGTKTTKSGLKVKSLTLKAN